jgi:precorrin-6B methylase 2
VKRLLKKVLFGSVRKPMRIPLGLYKGLTLNLDPNGDLAYFFGTYEVETHAWLRSAVAVARSFVDIGAGNGEMVVWALSHANIEQVLSYDAAPERFELLKGNLALNGFATDSRLRAVCGEFAGETSRPADIRNVMALPEPILLKMDIDGGEQHVLDELAEVLRRKQILVLIETHSRELDSACLAQLRAAGYQARQIAHSKWRLFLPEHRPLEFNQWIVAGNVEGFARALARR